MKYWQDAKESEIWMGSYSLASDKKHVECKLNYLKLKKTLYIDFTDEETLLCEEYFMDEHGSGRVFSQLGNGK